MKRINPLYIAILSLVALLFTIHLAHKEERELEFVKGELRDTQQLALKLSAIKKAYDPKKKDRLLRLIRLRSSLKKLLRIDKKGDLLVLQAQNLPLSDASWLLSKIFNDTYNITKLSLRKKSERAISLYMEMQ